MKKLLYIGAMSALLLSACSSHDEAPASEQAEAKEKKLSMLKQKRHLKEMLSIKLIEPN